MEYVYKVKYEILKSQLSIKLIILIGDSADFLESLPVFSDRLDILEKPKPPTTPRSRFREVEIVKIQLRMRISI